MLHAYQGYFENGRFVSSEVDSIPDKMRVIVTLFDDDIITPMKTRAQQQLEAVKAFISDNRGNEELSEEDYSELESGKYSLNFSGRELDL
jgi:hypothetical protein